MKKRLSLLLLAAGIGTLAACNHRMENEERLSAEETTQVPLVVRIGIPDESKAASDAVKDYQINKVQVFVFDHNGVLETDYYKELAGSETRTSVTLNTLTGSKTLYAVLNHERIKFTHRVSRLAELEGLLSDLSMNSPGQLVMSGKNTLTVLEYDVNKNASATPQGIDIYVKRLVCQILLDKVTVDFTGTSLEGGSLNIQEIYLKNVVGKCPLGMSGIGTPDGSDVRPLPLTESEQGNYSNWYNKGTFQEDAPEVTFDRLDLSCDTSGQPTKLSRSLFAYPNRTDTDSHADSFSQRMTRLVIKAHVRASLYADIDKDSYYVFDLPVLEGNHIYNVQNIRLTMLGKDSDDKDDDLQAGRITPTITVDPWSGKTSLNYEF